MQRLAMRWLLARTLDCGLVFIEPGENVQTGFVLRFQCQELAIRTGTKLAHASF